MRGRSLFALLGVGVAILALGMFRARDGTTARPADTADAAATTSPEAPGAALPTLLDFGRGECIPCQRMMPVLDSLAERHAGRIEVRYLDLAQPGNRERAAAMRVRTIPTQVLLAADGTEVARHEGFWELAEIETRLEELGWTPRR